jgi:hypothetical protein
MPWKTHFETVSAEAGDLREPDEEIANLKALRAQAAEWARGLVWLPNAPSSRTLLERCHAVKDALAPVLEALKQPSAKQPVSDDFRWLNDNVRLLCTEPIDAAEAFKKLKQTPHVRTRNGEVVPRVMAVAEGFLNAVAYHFSEQELITFCEAFEEEAPLDIQEIWALVPALRLTLLEQIAVRSPHVIGDPGNGTFGLDICIRSLREIGQTLWKEALEPLILVDRLLREDPAGGYREMDFESRDLYRKKLAQISKHSDCGEIEVARQALALAEEASRRQHADARVALRESHLGYYLVGMGAPQLHQKVGFRQPLGQRLQAWLRRHPDEFFLAGIEILTFAIMSVIVLSLTEPHSALGFVLLSMLALLLPSSQSAVQMMNYLVTSLFTPEILPKLDFSEGVPDDCVTMVAVPCLLLSEKQVHGLVEDLEVRFLGNHDRNIHFALLTDLPDSREPAPEDSPLVDLCSELIGKLNETYAGQTVGRFFLFHRHRVYNPREKAWMGWERKRGKLLDLNKLLRGQHDNFPGKVGDLSILPSVRFVITLDSDTELPRGSARRMIGTLAHPLNQAIVDPEQNIVVAGYGILQPRVGVSVQSTARSRLAAVYAGETGFDIYTRAVSDAYQDLYGEGIFTGKGIYEVDTVLQVLDGRFPQNALLSHDLIEGAYARVGLASDIEVIEDYPSHCSAHNRRKHRWLRGDWQITGWLLKHVPDELGARVANPISLISRWKILDNLRRSLVEPATFLLFVFGWLGLDGSPAYWTLAAIGILFLPTLFQFAFSLLRAAFTSRWTTAREALTTLYAANIRTLLALTFLPHQTLLSLDAVGRALVRRVVTRKRLLEWETAAEAELGARRRAPVDEYLDWMPALALGLGLLVLLVRPQSLPAALPILLLWGSGQFVTQWLNRPSLGQRNEASRKDLLLLRRSALHTWRYFTEFSTEEHHWLIPDNVQEHPAAVAARISPTNLGLLLNARQVACEMGYLTVPEFATLTSRTLATVAALRKHRGHALNWYDTRTLQPLAPLFVSSVDSGNLLASLWTLQQGCLERLRQPILPSALPEGLLDCLRALAGRRMFSPRRLSLLERQLRTEEWLPRLLDLLEEPFDGTQSAGATSTPDGEARWFQQQAGSRLRAIQEAVCGYTPWLLPEFAVLRANPALGLTSTGHVGLEQLPNLIEKLDKQLQSAALLASLPEQVSLYQRLREMLPQARSNTAQLIDQTRTIAGQAGKLANDMDFAFLLNRHRKLMSVGFDVESGQLHSACYDLLATESRTAMFAAIAKDDIPQESWFLAGRAHTLAEGRPVLISWTGTLFEYLMPALWMRSFSNTLLERSRAAAVRCQQAYAARKGVPWGISESAYFKLDEAGNYQYHAFGLPHLAMHKSEMNPLVISPYSTFLALSVDAPAALRNLRRMADLGWFGSYGFYEAADYTSRRRFWKPRYQLVPCWMAHHQGMSLLAVANFLRDGVVQRWFHAERRVQATELLLHEKPVAHVRRADVRARTAAA